MSALSVNKNNFEQIRNSEKPVLLDFYADWCGPCRAVSPLVDQIAEENPHGADPRRLGVNGEKELLGKGVHYCAHCDGRFYKDKTVIVVGGGNSATADALYLSKLAKKVYVVHRRDTLRATKIYHEPLLKAENVEFIWNSTVSQFIADGRVTGVKVKDANTEALTELSCDGVFISIGRTPATGFLADNVGLDDNGYVVADESTRTNISGVYAAGDVRTKALRQIVTAAADGAAAVHYAEKYLAEN